MIAQKAVLFIHFLPSVAIDDFLMAQVTLEDHPIHDAHIDGTLLHLFIELLLH